MAERDLGVSISLRIAPEDRGMVDGIIERVPAATMSQVLRAAIRLGLAQLDEDPMLVLTTAPPAPPSAAPAKPKRGRRGQ